MKLMRRFFSHKTGLFVVGGLACAAAGVFLGAHLLDAQILSKGDVALPSTAFAQKYVTSGAMRQKYYTRGNALVMDSQQNDGVTAAVGSVSGSDFVPNLELSRLNGFASFKLAPDISHVPAANRSYTFANNIVTYTTPDVDYVMYDTTTPVQGPPHKGQQTLTYDNGYEFEFVLKNKPASNVVSSPIETKNLDFYYQPALNAQTSDPSCTATDCGNEHRPENVVGSYAVYYANNLRGDYTGVGGQNYKTGKAFQIYRPKAIDAAGNWTWCDLRVDAAAGVLSVTVPQKFLNTASYPVTVDPTFGYTTVGGSYTTSPGNTMLGSVFASGAAGTLSSITARVYPDSGYPFQFAIYDSSFGLLANSGASSGSDTAQNWYTLGVSGTISSANYWLLLNTADTALYFYYDAGSTNQGLSKAQTYGTWPSSFSSPTYNTNKYSIYATYTVSLSGGNTPPAYRASGTFTASTGAITPPYPASMQAGDVCLLVVTSENQAITLTTANGFAEVSWSPQYAGTAATDPASRLAVFWKRTVGGDAAPVVADSGNNTEGQIHCYSGVISTGNPWDVGAGGNDGAANTTAGNIPGATTTVNDDLVVVINSTSNNATNQAQFSGWTNANLINLTERADNSNTAGLGGGHGIADGVDDIAGAYGTTTVTLANTSYQGAISIALKPAIGVVASLGKTTDGWSGAIPVSLSLNSLSSSTYPYARAKIVTPASQTFYVTTTWNGAANAYTGTIYPGSNYCPGCADPTTGTFTVTGQISTSSSFSPIAYESSAQTFTTTRTLRWNAVSTAAMGYSTDVSSTYSGGVWTTSITDFSINDASGTNSNVAVAIPFIPATANISITGVTLGGSAVSQGSAASTTNAWWWDTGQHALYIQVASLGTAFQTVTFTFTSDTDLWGTRIDQLSTYNIGQRTFYNGLMIGNEYIYSNVFGGGVVWNSTSVNAAGEQPELTGHNSTTGDVNLDCMERVAVHVDDTVLADSSGYYSANIRWASEWQNWITEATNDHITLVFHQDSTPSTGWIQYLNNHISVTRTQTYYSAEHYIKNDYQITNGDTVGHTLPFVWMREQWLGTDRNTNDRGRFAQSSADVTTETSTPATNLTAPWFMNYDTGAIAAQGVIFTDSQEASTTAYLLEHPPITTNVSPWAEWPITVTYPTSTSPQSSDIALAKTFGTVQPGNTVDFTFWQWGSAELSSVAAITSAISADATAVNPPSTMTQAAYRFFNNVNSTDVGTALAAQNTAITLGSAGAQFRMRVLNYVTSSALAMNRQFKLQYASMGTGTCASPQGTWTDVSAATPIAFYNNSTPASGAALTANANDPTDGANVIVNETYQEANPFTPSQGVVAVGQDGKWDFSLYDNAAPGGTTYCLRTVWNDGTTFAGYSAYPQVATASSGTVSCSTNPSTTGFGTLTLSGVATASSNTTTTLSCTYGAGCTLYVNDAGSGSSAGLWASAVSHLIGSANSTLSAGTEGYGIQAATTTAGSGATLTLASAYNQTGNTVGGLFLSQTSLASSTASFTSREVVTTHKAAISGVTSAGSYADTITYSCVGN